MVLYLHCFNLTCRFNSKTACERRNNGHECPTVCQTRHNACRPDGDEARMSSNPLSLVEMVQKNVVNRTNRRVKNLTVEVNADAVVIRGKTDSFHIKQLALHGVREVLPEIRLVNAIQVA